MKVRYEGPHQAVEVPVAGVIARRGETVDVDARLAESLLEQPGWKKPRRKKPHNEE